MKNLILAISTGLCVTYGASAHEGHATAKAALINKEAANVGQIVLKETPNGLFADIALSNLPEGWHAVHMHGVGACEPTAFKTAGGHISDGHVKSHDGATQTPARGFVHGEHWHASDLPNIYVHENGAAKVQYFLPLLTLSELLDDDGTAIIVHANADDYAPQPSSAAGGRIACGVLK